MVDRLTDEELDYICSVVVASSDDPTVSLCPKAVAEIRELREKKKALEVEIGLVGDSVEVCQGPCPGGCGRQVHKASWCLSCQRNKYFKDNARLREEFERYKHPPEGVTAAG